MQNLKAVLILVLLSYVGERVGRDYQCKSLLLEPQGSWRNTCHFSGKHLVVRARVVHLTPSTLVHGKTFESWLRTRWVWG